MGSRVAQGRWFSELLGTTDQEKRNKAFLRNDGNPPDNHINRRRLFMAQPQPILISSLALLYKHSFKMKIFVVAALLSLTHALPQKISFEKENVKSPVKSGEITVDTRAPSDYANCNCQCDSYTWVNSRGVRAGNCKV